jgi:hypothetical protein
MYKPVKIGRKRRSALPFVPSERRAYCRKPLTLESRVRAEEAQRNGTLFLLDHTLRCECGERVGAQETPAGGLLPNRHLPYKAPRVPRKRGP